MTCYLSKTLKIPFEQALARVAEELKREGFGILTYIDVKQALKDRLGPMRPCNVVGQEHGENGAEVAAIDPISSMPAVDNERLRDITRQVRRTLNAAISRL